MDQPTNFPTNKVTIAAIVGAVVTILTATFQFELAAGVEAAIVTVVGFVASYFRRN